MNEHALSAPKRALCWLLSFVLVAALLPSLGTQQAYAAEASDAGSAFVAEGAQVEAQSAIEPQAAIVTKDVASTVNQTEARKLLNMVNSARTQKGVAKLGWNTALEKTAMQRAVELATKFSHDRPDGSSCVTAFPTGATVFGENIAYQEDSTSAADVNKLWTNSSTHYANMVNGKFTSFASACVKVGNTYYWVEVFSNAKSTGMNTTPTNGTKTFQVKVPGTISLSGATVSFASKPAYNGAAQKPAPTVKVKGKTLKSGTDYTVTYKNNVNAGTATAVITGKGDYKGSVTKTFTIAKRSMTNATVSLSQSVYGYTGSALKPGVTVKVGGVKVPASNYTVKYANNAKVGKPTVTVTAKGANMTGKKSVSFAITPNVRYYVHRQTYGWENSWSKRDGASSGTTGQSKRLEGIKIKLANTAGIKGSIQYCTHVQKLGWQGWKSNGAMSGTSGKSYRLEAIKIKLTGDMAKKYDVYYRVHAQKFGWMGWAKNGASAGTEGYAYRLESIQIKLVPKGAAAPTSSGGVESTKGKAAFSKKK